MTHPTTGRPWTVYDVLVRLRTQRKAAEAIRAGRPAPLERVRPPGEPGEVTVITDPAGYARTALERAVTELAEQGEGGRNDALNSAAFSLGKLVGAEPPLLEEEAVTAALVEACEDNGYLAEEGEASVTRTIERALHDGMAEPLEWARPTPPPAVSPFEVPAWVFTPPAKAPVVIDHATGQVVDTDADERLAYELAVLRARRAAARTLDEEEAAGEYRGLPSFTLTEFLAQPDEEEAYLVADLLPLGGNVTLTAAYKTGKTTMVNDLVGALVDRRPFLGRFEVLRPPGRVVIYNYEVSEKQYRRWLREAGVENTDAVSIVNLRGQRAPLTSPYVEEQVTQQLRELECGVWIIDPFARAFVGSGDENENAHVSRWTDTVDIIKANAGVHSFVMPVHTGRAIAEVGKERARGATRLDDWPDVRWLLNLGIGEDSRRYFSANGRDVNIAEELLTYDESNRRLRFGGPDRKGGEQRELDDRILAFIQANPRCSQADVFRGVSGNDGRVGQGIKRLESQHKVRNELKDAVSGVGYRYVSTAPRGFQTTP